MYNIKYQTTKPHKLVDELQANGILELEEILFRPTSNTQTIVFSKLKEVVIVDEKTQEKSTHYEKYCEHINIIPATEIAEEKEEKYWQWEVFDPTELFAKIQAVVDAHKPDELSANDIRQLRTEAFKKLDIIQLSCNYKKLTEEQQLEVDIYQQAWLDAPETMVVPTKPSWMK